MEKAEMATSFGDLLDVLRVEILSRLPVKSLVRFRCVCKIWYNLVKDPNFIYKHLNKDDNFRLMVRCFYHDDTDEYDDLKSYFSFFSDKTLTDLSLQDLEPEMPGKKIGPYDGIFCLFMNNSMITLWNAATNEYRVLPKCKARLPCYTKVLYPNVGFGLDPVTNNNKLVLILTLWHEKRSAFHEFSHVTLYSFSTNSWKDLKGFEMRHDYMHDRIDSIYLNGVCYWLVLRADRHKAILSFDMSDEWFQEIEGPNIPQPTSLHADALTPWTLGIYDGSLSLLHSDNFAHSFDLWIMRGRSWIKQLTFGPFTETYKPIGFWRKGEYFLESSNNRLILYDSRYQEMRDLGITGLWFSVHLLKECLITIKEKDGYCCDPIL